MVALTRITPPAAEPVTLAEAKAQARVDHADEDALIAGLIAAATQHLDGWEGTLGRALVTQTWAARYPGFGCVLRLPLRPVQSVTSVVYRDATGAEETLDAGLYRLQADELGAYVERVAETVWPETAARSDAVTVTFVAGYGDPADVPRPIRQAMLMLIEHWYDNRGAVLAGAAASPMPLAVDALLGPYRVAAF